MDKPEEKIGFMCGVAWQHEIGETGGVEIHATEEACVKACGCTDECGIVKVKLTLVEWVKEQEF